MRRPSIRQASNWWYALLAIPCIAMLWVPFFNRMEPAINGIPFFYWYQFSWVPIAALLTLVVHKATDNDEPIELGSVDTEADQ
ncbi:DUF3311 domain-containing protein [Caballeronia sp. 15711]|uniref:DUF3311 domain-containing protein n=1 Tax=Caballeronia sp. 15711 TaxID=3391029 RepID=UPI0039E2F55B